LNVVPEEHLSNEAKKYQNDDQEGRGEPRKHFGGILEEREECSARSTLHHQTQQCRILSHNCSLEALPKLSIQTELDR
jgi:hypothetical protein